MEVKVVQIAFFQIGRCFLKKRHWVRWRALDLKTAKLQGYDVHFDLETAKLQGHDVHL